MPMRVVPTMNVRRRIGATCVGMCTAQRCLICRQSRNQNQTYDSADHSCDLSTDIVERTTNYSDLRRKGQIRGRNSGLNARKNGHQQNNQQTQPAGKRWSDSILAKAIKEWRDPFDLKIQWLHIRLGTISVFRSVKVG